MSTQIIISNNKSFRQDLLSKLISSPIVILLTDKDSPILEQIISNHPKIAIEHSFHKPDPLARTQSSHQILTDREQEVLKLIAQGFSTNEIAEKLFISSKTVATHKSNLLLK